MHADHELAEAFALNPRAGRRAISDRVQLVASLLK
jgi:hypothetical protein